ncbi:MAG TPA: tRNA pseudouridine(55) synthase TruB [Bacteroidota bacterium]|nr:tRNA pseudouridine(55) synthase TruB [Bacteroidota bacterium]
MTLSRNEPVTMASDVTSLDFESGEILLVDKPKDWTSFDVVHRVRDLFNVRKVGHAGTLDPKATGLLILCTGRKTKDIDSFGGQEKEYEGTMQLGATTASLDSETPEENLKDFSRITEQQLREAFASFIGTQLQVPPMYSAVKYDGKPLYKLARKGRSREREPREVTVSDFTLVRTDLPLVFFRIVCSKGTYIRSVVDECGKKLGCGAYVKELRRTRIGGLSLQQALQIEELHQLSDRCASAKHVTV